MRICMRMCMEGFAHSCSCRLSSVEAVEVTAAGMGVIRSLYQSVNGGVNQGATRALTRVAAACLPSKLRM
jgi:hypothetical protein